MRFLSDDSAFMDAGFNPEESGAGEEALVADEQVRVMFTRVRTSIGPVPSDVFEVIISTPQGVVELATPAEWLRARSWSRAVDDHDAWCAQTERDDTVADMESQFGTTDTDEDGA